VKFDQAFAAEYAKAFPNGGGPEKEEWFNGQSELGRRAREMLQAWEAGDAEVRGLWRMMNDWCEGGFEETYRRMGVSFTRVDRESETYILGKDLVDEGLAKGIFTRRKDGAVVFDQARIGLEGEKVVLRADGTSVYVTQDLGTAARRYEQLRFDHMTYVVGNEQDRHFQVLFGILGELRPELKGRMSHLSYGMVELPAGKMKSREGTVVDADDLLDDLHAMAYAAAKERNPDLDDAEVHRRAEAIALGGLKFFLLKFAPGTTFIFDKEKSIAIEGETGAYCQYAYARAGSILRKLGADADEGAPDFSLLTLPVEREVMTAMLRFPGEIRTAALDLKPNLVCKATFELAKAFATFFNHPEARVIGAEPSLRTARVALVRGARRMVRAGLELLGITPLEEM
jgi:arginyl-tRNA synthetase